MGKFDENKFETGRNDWETPWGLFNRLNEEFHFTCDVAANKHNTKVPDNYIDEETDALSIKWEGVCWMNPPYGKDLKTWIEKAYWEGVAGAVVVALIPARTNTNWWHDFCMKAKEIRFIRGRPKFIGAEYGLPLPLAIVIFAPRDGLPRFGSYSLNGVEQDGLWGVWGKT